MSNHPQTSDPLDTMFGPVTVTARPVRKGHQLAPEIVVTDSGKAEIMHLSPADARALAAALTEAADRAEQ
jgi:hypothetical protein